MILPLFRTTESVCLFLDSISLGTVKVKIYDADLKVIEKLIGRKKAMESCDKKGKKVSEASIRKAENDNLKQAFEKPKTITFRNYSRPFLFLVPGHKSLKGFFW